MESERLAECLSILGWTGGELARRLGIRERTAREWLAGSREIPPRIADWIERMTKHMQAGPEPPKAG